MSRIKSVTVDQATGLTAQLYTAIKGQLGSVPNLFQAMGQTPKVLETYLGLSGAQESLSGAEKELIALVVSQANDCEYCLAAHTVLGKMNKLSESEIIAARKGQSTDSKRNALLNLTHQIVIKKGNISDEVFSSFIAAGYSASQIPEIVLAISQNIFTNYLNNINYTEIDFPRAEKI